MLLSESYTIEGVKPGEAIAARREALGLTQDDVAAEMGVKRESVSHWERGKHLPRSKRLAKLADVLQTSASCLLSPIEANKMSTGQDTLLQKILRLSPEAREALDPIIDQLLGIAQHPEPQPAPKRGRR